MQCLDSINSDSLSEADRYYYDFLTLKAQDKAYVPHTSDSLYLRVHDYYAKKGSDDFFTEVLYYGGRVYSDLGDYPTALQYFHQALDRLPEDTDNLSLRGCVLSQTGRLLDTLRLYDEAIPYFVSSLENVRKINDTLNIICDLQLVGGNYLRAERYDSAEKYFKESLVLSHYYASDSQVDKSKMYLAEVKFRMGQTDSALQLIRNATDVENSIVRNSALAYAANIYLEVGILDTALHYAQEIIIDQHLLHHEIAYQVLLSPKLRGLIHPDTLNQYIEDYRSLLGTFYNENQSQLAINQQSLYNCQLHERQKAEAERSNTVLWRWVIVFSFTMAFMTIIILLLKNKDKSHIIELRQALENLEMLRKELNISSQTIPSCSGNTEKELREKLKNDLMQLYENSVQCPVVSSVILQSAVYQAVLDLVNVGKSLKEDDALWA